MLIQVSFGELFPGDFIVAYVYKHGKPRGRRELECRGYLVVAINQSEIRVKGASIDTTKITMLELGSELKFKNMGWPGGYPDTTATRDYLINRI